MHRIASEFIPFSDPVGVKIIQLSLGEKISPTLNCCVFEMGAYCQWG
ncbi:hypothetical protein JCM19238_4351 [Vibrio ponticus]|nr:hypothetical protein JCM19238_4351 [Vibrio ponticus]